MERTHLDLVNNHTAKMLNTLFGQSYTPQAMYQEEPLPTFDCDYLAQIGLRSKSSQLHLMLGLKEATAKDLLQDVLSYVEDMNEQFELIKSALGELSNTVACELAANQQIIDSLGHLLPTPPLVWVISQVEPDFIKGDGIRGSLCKGSLSINTFLSILPAPVNADDDSETSWSPTESLSIYDPHSAE